MRNPIRICFATTCTLFFLFSIHSGMGNGGKGKFNTYMAQTSLGSGVGDCFFTVDVNPTIFYLTTINSKYQVLAMRIKNRARTALVLDKAKDKVELRFGSKRVSGILNLAANDRATWDSLGKEMKDLVMYPSQVEGGEEEGIYIFIPQKSETPRIARLATLFPYGNHTGSYC